MSTTSLLLSPPPHRRQEFSPLQHNRRRVLVLHSWKLHASTRISSKAVEFKSPSNLQQQDNLAQEESRSTVLLDVSGMMCGACVTRVKSILSADDRVDSAVVNMLTETAAIKLKDGVGGDLSAVAEELAKRASANGFEAPRRASEMGLEGKVRKWRETVEKKDAYSLRVVAWHLLGPWLCSAVALTLLMSCIPAAFISVTVRILALFNF